VSAAHSHNVDQNSLRFASGEPCLAILVRKLFFAAATLRGGSGPLALKEKKDNEEKDSNRETGQKSSEQVQHVMDC